MVSIVPADNELFKELTAGISNEKNNLYCLAAFDGKEKLGYIVYRLIQSEAVFLQMESQDFLIADGIVRAALNAAAEKGAAKALCNNALLFPILENIGFKNSGNNSNHIYSYISDVLSKDCC